MDMEIEQEEDLRDTIGAAFEAEAPEESAPVEAPPVESADIEASRENRDKLGRFTAKLQEDGKGNLPDGTQAPDPSQQANDMPGIIQAALRPAAREHWATLPEPVRQEIVRRENEMQASMRESASARNIAHAFSAAVTPYLPVIQAEGVDPLTAVTNLMQVATTLRMGTVAEKAGMIAKMVDTYGVDIFALDQAIAGGNHQQAQPQQQGFDPRIIQQAVAAELAPYRQAAEQQHEQQRQQIYAEVGSELQQFAQKHEFYGDVRKQMADMMEVAEMHGQTMSLEDAYQACCMLHPEIKRIIVGRQSQQSAQSLTQAAQRSRSAAVSVRGAAPVGNPNQSEATTVREAIEAAIEHSSRV
jgi:hypothetical protein